MNRSKIIAYGLTSTHMDGLGPEPAEIADTLADRGVAGVFLKEARPILAAALRRAGLAVYASMPIFLAQAGVWERWPESRPVTAAGLPAPVEEWYRPGLPTHAGLRQQRLREIESLLETQPLDGLWLDFIRWPARWEKGIPALYDSSFDPLTLSRFVDDTGIAVPVDEPVRAAEFLLSSAQAEWLAWRMRVVTDFVAEARALRDRLQPDALLGLFLLPWVGSEPDRTPVPDAHLRIAGQHPGQLGRVADVLSPMVYHRLCGRDSRWPAAVTRAVVKTGAPAQVWPVIERLADDPAPADEHTGVLRAAAAAGRGPVIVFNLAGMLAAGDVG